MENRRVLWILASLCLSIGVALAGWFIGHGFRQARTDHYVTVKGVSERIVQADLALWPLRFVATGNDLAQVQGRSRRDAERVRAFLLEAGMAEDEIELASLQVTDAYAQPYRSGPVQNRYIIAQTITVRTDDVARVEAASGRIGELVDAGVILSSDYGPQANTPTYLFTGLTGIKPEMIAEATRNARAAAEQFAADSGARVGAIRRANQGLFQILPRDQTPAVPEAQQVFKTVRVVSTIDFTLVE